MLCRLLERPLPLLLAPVAALCLYTLRGGDVEGFLTQFAAWGLVGLVAAPLALLAAAAFLAALTRLFRSP